MLKWSLHAPYALRGDVVTAMSAKPASSGSDVCVCVCPLSWRSAWSRQQGLRASHMPGASGVHGAPSHLCVGAHARNIGKSRVWFMCRLCGRRSRLFCARMENRLRMSHGHHVLASDHAESRCRACFLPPRWSVWRHCLRRVCCTSGIRLGRMCVLSLVALCMA